MYCPLEIVVPLMSQAATLPFAFWITMSVFPSPFKSPVPVTVQPGSGWL
jgi:hypothetical protein